MFSMPLASMGNGEIAAMPVVADVIQFVPSLTAKVVK